jgi:xanthine dehydrogenase YagR molybdenum-binding subunit
MHKELLKLAKESSDSPLAGAKPDQIEARDGGLYRIDVRVHQETGEVRVSRWVCSLDCGNPRTATSQLRGGIIMGIGMALTEETRLDERRGRIMNPSLSEYHLPVNLDVPNIEALFLSRSINCSNRHRYRRTGRGWIRGSVSARRSAQSFGVSKN